MKYHVIYAQFSVNFNFLETKENGPAPLSK